MALFKSNMLSAIRGSVNGTVYSQNKSGAYMRNRSLVTNPNTASQVAARTGFAGAVTEWRLLSDANKDTWRLYAAGTPVTNRLGDTIYLSGANMYTKTNAFRQFLSLAQQAAAPALMGLAQQPVFTSLPTIYDSASAAPNTIDDYTYDAGLGSTAAGAQYAMWISNPVSLGVSFYKGPWNFAGVNLGSSRTLPYTSPIAVGTAQVFFLKLRVMDEQGRLGAPQIIGPIVATNNP